MVGSQPLRIISHIVDTSYIILSSVRYNMFLAILLKKGHITLLISCTPTYGWCNAAWCTALCRSCRWSCLLCTPHKHQALLSSPKHDHSQLAAEKQTKKKKTTTIYMWKTDHCTTNNNSWISLFFKVKGKYFGTGGGTDLVTFCTSTLQYQTTDWW